MDGKDKDDEESKEKKSRRPEFDVAGVDSYSYDSERSPDDYGSSYGPSGSEERDSEIYMSLCLGAFKSLEPGTYGEMQSIFDKHKVSYELMCDNPSEIIKDPDLVVKIESNFYPWSAAAPMIMAYLVFKQPLPPDQIGPSLNQ